VTSRVVPVPPPVLDLDLVLRCPGLKRQATRALAARSTRAGRTTVLARVTPRGTTSRRPTGVVRFSAAGRTLATALLDRRTGLARLPGVAGVGRARIVVRYLGDARFAAGSATARTAPRRR
jgi:hypothetical protein